MARLISWISPTVMHALGWALIHSLWQGAGIAALAAGLMAFSRRPSVRYLVGVGALVLMLAAPVATFFVLMKPAAPVQARFPQIRAAVACRTCRSFMTPPRHADRAALCRSPPSQAQSRDPARFFAGFSSAAHPALAGGSLALRRGAAQLALCRKPPASGAWRRQAIQPPGPAILAVVPGIAASDSASTAPSAIWNATGFRRPR